MSAPSERRELRWICLTISIFDDAKIKIIETMPEGDALIICWLRLLCMAGKNNADGAIIIAPQIPLNDEVMAMLLNKPVAIVRLALQTFLRMGMIELIEEHGLRIVNWEKHQNSKGLEQSREKARLRAAKHRERQKLLLATNTPADHPRTQISDPFTGYAPERIERWRSVFNALFATGKLPALTIEHLVLVDREYPQAQLIEHINEVVAEAKAEADPIRNVVKWLRPVVKALEQRQRVARRNAEQTAASTADKF